MKLLFDDKSYIECKKDGDQIIIAIVARDHENKLKKISNAVQLTIEEFKKLISDIL